MTDDNIKQIISAISQKMGTSVFLTLLGKPKTLEVINARHLSIYILHCEHQISVSRLARLFNCKIRNIFYTCSKVRFDIEHKLYYHKLYEKVKPTAI